MEDKYFTISEIAELAQVARSTVYEWMKSGDLPFVFIGKHRRIPKSAWINFVRPGNPGEAEDNDQKNLEPALA